MQASDPAGPGENDPVTALRVGTRGSQLALWQAHFVAEAVVAAGGPSSEIVVITTSGDRFRDVAVSHAGGKRLFVKEIEDALLAGQIDLAVHSAKDLPAELPDGTTLAAAPEREDPRDAVVLPAGHEGSVARAQIADQAPPAALELLSDLGSTPCIGTGSVRRVAQLRRLLPTARFEGIRGNLDTRLRKLDDGGPYDALILAAAGLRRLGFRDRIAATLPLDACVPAPGQGAIAVEVRADDAAVRHHVERISDAATMASVAAERALVATLGGGCQVPIGAIATPAGREMRLDAIVTSLDGRRAVQQSGAGSIDDPNALGRHVGERLLRSGAREILEEVLREQLPAAEDH